ncbi:MAG: M14 family metallopeptidase [Candidatus Zambryskibacteria bacterium]|nr:M14 family metallopeptidase [Candidatus Zambryskibacteria bacterium]
MRAFFSKPRIIIIIVFVALGVFGLFSLYGKPPVTLPIKLIEDSNNLGPKYKVIGMSVEGRKIESYTHLPAQAGGTGDTKLLFVGGIHGGYEWNSVLLAYQFMDYLGKNPGFVPNNITVTVIPSVNPDGVYKVVGKEGRFTTTDVSINKQILTSGRFNAHNVDLNRNFDCKWQPKSIWQEKVVSAGSEAFSEPESQVLKNFILENNPDAVIFWHSQSGSVYASKCEAGVLSGTLDIMNVYAKASGYSAVETFDAYATSGDAEGWLASIGIPAITVELKTHETIELEQNLSGVKALFEYYSQKKN